MRKSSWTPSGRLIQQQNIPKREMAEFYAPNQSRHSYSREFSEGFTSTCGTVTVLSSVVTSRSGT